MRIYDIEEAERQTTRIRRHLDMGMPEAAANEFTGFITAQDVFTTPIDPDHLSVLSDYFRHWAFLVSMPIGQVDAIWNIWKDSVKANESTVGTSDEETTNSSAQPESDATG